MSNLKEETIKKILENANGSWVDMITEGYEAGYEAATPATPSMQWVKASERLPEIIERKALPKHVRHMKKRWKGEPYVAKAVAYYFPEHFKTVEWEDWDDYDEKDFPYTENDTEQGCVWLRPGWYSSIDCDKCEGYWSQPLEVVEWLDENPSPIPVKEGTTETGANTVTNWNDVE